MAKRRPRCNQQRCRAGQLSCAPRSAGLTSPAEFRRKSRTVNGRADGNPKPAVVASQRRLWIAPEHGYLAIRLDEVATIDPRAPYPAKCRPFLLRTVRIIEDKRLSGLWLPVTGEITRYTRNGMVRRRTRAAFSNYRVDASIFQPRLDPRMQFWDDHRSVMYHVNQDGALEPDPPGEP